MTWLQQHERLILGIALLAVVVFLGNKVLNVQAHRAALADGAASATLQAQVDANAQLKQAVQDDRTTYEKVLASVTAQNQALAAAITTRAASATQQQKKDETAPVPELATRWQELLPHSTPSEFKYQPADNSVNVSAAASRQTVVALEEVPMLKDTMQYQDGMLDNDQKQITSLTSLSDGLQKQVDGLNNQIVDANKKCQTQISDIKAQERKSKRNWFVGGVITGVTIVSRFL